MPKNVLLLLKCKVLIESYIYCVNMRFREKTYVYCVNVRSTKKCTVLHSLSYIKKNVYNHSESRTPHPQSTMGVVCETMITIVSSIGQRL